MGLLFIFQTISQIILGPRIMESKDRSRITSVPSDCPFGLIFNRVGRDGDELLQTD